MKKSILTSVFTLLLIITCVAQEKQWESLKINNEIEILFPEKYTSKLIGDKTFYKCKLADSTTILSFIESDLSALGLSTEQMEEQANTKKFWQDYVPSMVKQIPNAKLIKYERKNVGSTSGALIIFKKDSSIFHQLVLIKGLKNYLVTFTNRNGKIDEKLKKEFFEKVKILN